MNDQLSTLSMRHGNNNLFVQTSKLIALITLLLGCKGGGSSTGTATDQTPDINFSDPEEVTIVGYSGDAQEPYISRDGSILFFNNLNSATLDNGDENDTNIHYASRIDDLTFQYLGEVQGANVDQLSGVNELEGVASLSEGNQFYFVNTTDYLDSTSPDYLRSLFKADYVGGEITNIESLPNLKNDRPANQSPILGELNFDAEISADGDALYFVEGTFSGNPFPDTADLGLAIREGGSFEVSPDSSALFGHINTPHLEYAPSISLDQLELFFTRARGSVLSGYDFGIYRATRSSLQEPWGHIERLDVADGEFVEAPSISGDGKRLYYHQKLAGVFKIYVVERKQ